MSEKLNVVCIFPRIFDVHNSRDLYTNTYIQTYIHVKVYIHTYALSSINVCVRENITILFLYRAYKLQKP